MGIGQDLCSRRGHAREQIEDQIPAMAHRVLDVVSEDPEEPHVAEDVEPRAVQEHRGEDTQVVRVSGGDALEAPAQGDTDAGGHTAQELSGDESPFTGGCRQRVRRAGALEKDPDDVIIAANVIVWILFQVDAASACAEPAPWKRIQTMTLAAMMPTVTLGVSSVGLSSLYGKNMGLCVTRAVCVGNRMSEE